MFKEDHDSKGAPVDASVVSYIERILPRRKLVFHFPGALEAQFVRKRVADSLAFIRTGEYLLIMLFCMVVLNVLIYFREIAIANDYAVVINSYIPLATAIMFILYGSRLRAVQHHFYWYMTPVSVTVLCIISTLAVQYQDDYGEFVIYHLMIAIILMAFGLRFILPLFIGILTFVGLFTVGYNHYYHLDFEYAKFSNYYILYCCVTVALSAISEWHERLAFLQSLLIDYQTEELTRLNDELERIAHEDALTGIANRRYFDDIARKEWDRALRDQQPLTILLLDVDFFKRYNDCYGHDAGDHCLYNIAQTLQQCIMRTSDVVARYGGEEFAILLANTKASGGVQVADRILQAIDQLHTPHSASSVCSHVTVSIGVSTLVPDNDSSLTHMLKQADQALYHAKHRGRHQFVIYQTMSQTTDSAA